MLDRLTDAFFSLDTDWRFRYLNDRAEELLERSRAALLGRVMWDEFPETVETQFLDGLYRAMDEQVPVSFEVYHTPLETWFEVRAYPSETGLSVYMRDVTDRKARETKLARYGAVVEAVEDGIVTLDSNTRIVSINDVVEESLDVDRADVLGEHVETLLELAAVDPTETVAIGRAISDVTVGNAASRRVTVEFADARGDRRVGEVRLVPIEHDAATIAGVVRDVTDQHEHERVVTSLHELTRWLLQSDDPEEICSIAVHAGSDLLELPISGIWLLEEERGYLDPIAATASAYEELDGFPRFRQGEGLVWDAFEAGDLVQYDDLREVEGRYNPETPIRSEIIAPIGTHGVLMTASLEPDAFDQTDVDLLSTLVENTRAALDRADRERVLRERTEQLERQTERLEAIANVLSTDLKRGLEAVEEALEGEEADVGEWEFPLSEDGATARLDRAERLVDDVREFARNATTVGSRTRIDLERAVDAAVRGSNLESAAVVVEEGATLRADPDRFGHFLETIFDDAAARSEGDVTVQVGLVGLDRPVDGPRGFFLLDDAPEIPAAVRERVFDPSVEDATDGLGLAVARTIAEAHGWTVSISRGDNGGTRFEVRDVTTLERR